MASILTPEQIAAGEGGGLFGSERKVGSTPVIQTSFNAGEWAPALNARVDVQKYHAGAALLRNFFVDYRGGATTRPGTRFITQAASNGIVRLIPFQASTQVSFVLEFGDLYVRMLSNGAPVTTPATGTITGITNANPAVITVTSAAGLSNGQLISISGVNGMVQINGGTYRIAGLSGLTFNLTDVLGNTVNSTTYGTYTSGGAVNLDVQVTSPYTQFEVFGIKYTQNVNILILCHPNHPPYELILNSATSWTLRPITFGTTAAAPTGLSTAVSGLSSGSVYYAYVVTSVDANGDESGPSAFATASAFQDMRSVGGTITISWSAVPNSESYNVYKAIPVYGAGVSGGAQFGFIGNCTGTSFADSNIQPDFAQGPPVLQNPFTGSGGATSGVATLTLTNPGSQYLGVPAVSIAAPPSGTTATAIAVLTTSNIGKARSGVGYVVGDVLSGPNGIVLQVTSVDGTGAIISYNVVNSGVISGYGTLVPYNPFGASGGSPTTSAQWNGFWDVQALQLTNPGSGYTSAPAVTIVGGSPQVAVATATASLAGSGGGANLVYSGNPTIPGFFQQRLVLAGPVLNYQQFDMSQPGAYYNFNISNPIVASDAIQGALVSGQLNTIESMVSMPSGLIMFSDKQAWLINGGSAGSAVSAIQIVANAQSYNGASAIPPVVCNNDILYVQAKQSIVRDLVYNFYTNVYTGTDISVLSSHLFYNYSIVQWSWAEEPFKLIWAVRNDGILLTLTFVKEQEMVAWAHSDTQGAFRSVATVVEQTTSGLVDATYFVVQRTINQSGTLVTYNYIERLQELYYPSGYQSSWQVDAGINYTSGTPASTFWGAQHLGGLTVTGVADGAIITPFVMPYNGTFTLPIPASIVTVGLSFTPQLQTLAIDLGEPTAQGKRKKITAVTVRVKDALGLSIGGSSASLTPMKDLVLGNIGTMTNGQVTGFVTGDARTIIDPNWTVPGQYFIQQSNPYPASILGVIPEITVGDTQK